jgi:hypothetical protein
VSEGWCLRREVRKQYVHISLTFFHVTVSKSRSLNCKRLHSVTLVNAKGRQRGALNASGDERVTPASRSARER